MGDVYAGPAEQSQGFEVNGSQGLRVGAAVLSAETQYGEGDSIATSMVDLGGSIADLINPNHAAQLSGLAAEQSHEELVTDGGYNS